MFVTSIERLTGSKNSVSQTVRLERFLGSYDDIYTNTSKQQQYGIKQLLTADSDTRLSYYLSQAEIEEINISEKYVDDAAGIEFFKTDFRFDDYKDFRNLLQENADEEELIVFTHEWLLEVPPRRNVFAYLFQLYKSMRVKRNIKIFMHYAKNNMYAFVHSF